MSRQVFTIEGKFLADDLDDAFVYLAQHFARLRDGDDTYLTSGRVLLMQVQPAEDSATA